VRSLRAVALAGLVVGAAATVSVAGPSSPAPDARPFAPVERLGSAVAGSPDGGSPDARSDAVPDHSACKGLTGLENAACRVRANLEAHPNPGLERALARLGAKLELGTTGRRPEHVQPPGLGIAAAHGPPGLGIAAAHGAPVTNG